jgi:nucleotide-binding universal stress UspA family protein
MSPIRRILFASDFSRGSRPALASAVELARALKAEILLIHTLVPIVPEDGMYATYVDWGSLERATREAAETQIDRLATMVRKRGIGVTTLLASGNAADQIVRTAKAKKAGLIVMGTHGRTGLSRLVMGSVAMRVMSSASCPVVTVRAK